MQSKNKKMTIKINGKDKSYKENLPVHNWQSTQQQTAAAEETDELTDSKEFSSKTKKSPPAYNKIHYIKGNNNRIRRSFTPNNKGWLKVLMPIITAVVVGLFLGILLLKVVENEGGNTDGVPLKDATLSQASSDTYNLNEQTFQVIQGGAFTTEDQANQMVSSNVQKGYPSIMIEQDNKYLVLVGIGEKANSLIDLDKYYEEKNVETFKKALTINGKAVSVTQEEVGFLGEANTIFNEILALVKSEGNSSSDTTIVSSLKERLKTIESTTVTSPIIANLQKELGDTMVALEAFISSNKQSDYLLLQQHLLNFYKLLNEL
ncbi:hypothetical protein WAK64_01140 [Bacillus spongiae]|uniref:SPOR domain-containing protein n=1 Tax=Bacillus spongiae TaxID=2683610 RepID=A0ABU8H8R7_9BACI